MNNYYLEKISIFLRNLGNYVDISLFEPNIEVIQLKNWKSYNSEKNDVLTKGNKFIQLKKLQ